MRSASSRAPWMTLRSRLRCCAASWTQHVPWPRRYAAAHKLAGMMQGRQSGRVVQRAHPVPHRCSQKLSQLFPACLPAHPLPQPPACPLHCSWRRRSRRRLTQLRCWRRRAAAARCWSARGPARSRYVLCAVKETVMAEFAALLSGQPGLPNSLMHPVMCAAFHADRPPRRSAHLLWSSGRV